MYACRHTECGDKSIHQRLLVMRTFTKKLHPVSELFLITGRDAVFALTELHFAQMHDSVCPFYYQVYLASSCLVLLVSLVKPGRNLRCDTTDIQRMKDLADMHQTQQLECQSLPRLHAV